VKRFIARHLYTIAVGASLAAFLTAREFGLPLEAVVVAASVVVLVAAALLERLLPFEPAWRRSDGDTTTDAASAIVLIGLVDPLLKAAMPVLAIAALRGVGTPWRAFPIGWPFMAQVLLALLWIEFAKYWSHRAHHRSPALWWLHALHHGSRRLYWLNNFRFHPLNHAINSLVSMLPLWLAGTPAEVLLGVAAISQPVLMLQHANLDLRSGWLNHVFSTNEVHRWHHSTQPHEANSNFGSALMLWDHVFGTFRHEAGRRRPVAVGLFGNGGGYPSARSYLQQLRSMFSPACCYPNR